jgi:hypothetical protein
MDLVRRQQVPWVLRDGTALDYAAGLRIVKYRGLNTVRHGGAWAGYRAELLRFPDQRTSIATLCNRGDADPGALADRVADHILAGQMESLPAATQRTMAAGIRLPVEMLRPRAGTWRGRRTGEFRTIALDGDSLTWRFAGGALPLTPLAANRLQLPTGTVVTFETEGGRPVMRADTPIAGETTFDLMPPFAPTQAQLQEYIGRYSADELGVTYDVAADSTGLVVRLHGRELARMSPLWPDTFGGAGVVMAFERANRKRLTGLTVQAGRVRNIAFTRLP